MRCENAVRTAKIGSIVLSLAFCVLGVLALCLPDMSIAVMGIAVGILLIGFGVVRITGYFSKDLYSLAFQYDLAQGLLLVVLGVFLLLSPEHLMNILCVVLGISILSDGLFKTQMALDARRFGLGSWGLILVLALIGGIAGLLLIFWPRESSRVITMLMGAALLTEGVLNLSVVLCAVRIARQKRPVQTDFTDND